MRKFFCLFLLLSFCTSFIRYENESSWIRINWLGYKPHSMMVAIWCSKDTASLKNFQLVDAATSKIVYTASAGKAFENYGPFAQIYRLNFSSFTKPGRYYLQTNNTKSPEFNIGNDV